ncbi:MAG: extracellular solute-binding protein [Lachnospiraceae bacterium]|nr:extracellular solute-binding protein [Lachnospiraceae bacterium]
MFKKVLAVTLAGVLMAGMTACGGGNKTEPVTTKAAAAEPESKDHSPEASGESHEPVTISMWWPGSGEGYEQLAKGMADLVHDTYDWITVDYLVIPWGDYDSKMNVAFAGGTAPDIFGVGMNPLPNYVQTGNLLELENVLPEDWDGWTDIPQNVLDCATYDGHFYGVMMCDVRPMIYRKDLFEKAGLTDVPKNKEELWDYAKKLTERGEDGKVTLAGFQIQTTGYADQTLFFVSLMHGQKQLWDDNYNLLLLEPTMIDAMEYTKRFITEGLCDYSDAAVGTSDFASGKAAISLSTSCNELGNIRGTLGLDKIGVAAPPTDKGSNFLGGTIVSVNNKSSHMEATMLAYEVMTGTKGCELAGLCAGFCPPRESALKAYVAQNPEIYGVVAEILPSAKTYGPLNPYFSDFRNIALLPWMEKIYYGKIDVREGLENAIRDYDEARKQRDADN